MPVRPRRQRLAPAPWGPEIHLALTIGPCPLNGPSDEVLRAAWTAYRACLLRDVEDPSSLWATAYFDGPPELRPERRALHPVPHDPDADRADRAVPHRPILRPVPTLLEEPHA